jgi:hypothetical protein
MLLLPLIDAALPLGMGFRPQDNNVYHHTQSSSGTPLLDADLEYSNSQTQVTAGKRSGVTSNTNSYSMVQGEFEAVDVVLYPSKICPC